jgi:hypothetical protein
MVTLADGVYQTAVRWLQERGVSHLENVQSITVYKSGPHVQEIIIIGQEHTQSGSQPLAAKPHSLCCVSLIDFIDRLEVCSLQLQANVTMQVFAELPLSMKRGQESRDAVASRIVQSTHQGGVSTIDFHAWYILCFYYHP